MLTGYAPSMASVPLAFTAWTQTLAKEQSDASIRNRWLSLPSGSQYLSDMSYMGTGSPSSDRFAFFAEGNYDEGQFHLLELICSTLNHRFRSCLHSGLQHQADAHSWRVLDHCGARIQGCYGVQGRYFCGHWREGYVSTLYSFNS